MAVCVPIASIVTMHSLTSSCRLRTGSPHRGGHRYVGARVDVRKAQHIDVLGQRAAVLFSVDLSGSSEQTLLLGTSALASGLYVARLEAQTFLATQTLTVAR